MLLITEWHMHSVGANTLGINKKIIFPLPLKNATEKSFYHSIEDKQTKKHTVVRMYLLSLSDLNRFSALQIKQSA